MKGLQVYLVAYNSVHVLVWLLVLLIFLSLRGDLSQLGEAAFYPVAFVLCWTFLEVLHDTCGLVQGADMNFFVRLHCKVLRRAHLYALAAGTGQVATGAAGLVTLHWMVLDLVRYPFYALNTARRCPAWLRWLRYHEFYIMYPIGFVSELALWYFIVTSVEGLTRLWCIAYVIYRLAAFPTNYLRMIRISEAALARPKPS